MFPSFGLRTGRAGRTTAPVGRVSGVLVVVVTVGSVGRGSLPLKTRERRRFSSNATPGVRAAAPVGRSGKATAGMERAGRALIMRCVRSPPAEGVVKAYAG